MNCKNFSLSLLIMSSFLFLGVISAYAQVPDVQPYEFTIKIKNDQVLGKYQGLKVRVCDQKGEFFSHNFFMSLNDIKSLARKRGAECTYNESEKKLNVGSKSVEVIPVDPKSKESFVPFKVRILMYKGKPYFDVWGFYGGMGFTSLSRMNYGYYLYER